MSFDTKLSKDMYPGRSDKAHFQQANQNLHQQMKADPEFANMMETLHPGITKGVQPGARGAYPRRAPTKDVTWHHGVEPGNMQLVPRSQHSAPGAVQETLHPGGVGGMSTWGGGR
ncbi:HNH endonuclease [Vibrio splendidus]